MVRLWCTLNLASLCHSFYEKETRREKIDDAQHSCARECITSYPFIPLTVSVYHPATHSEHSRCLPSSTTAQATTVNFMDEKCIFLCLFSITRESFVIEEGGCMC